MEEHYKVKQFIIENPVSAAFLRREKGRLPYSVFKATADDVHFIKSNYKGRPPTVYFPYPSYVSSKNPNFDQSLIKSYSRRGELEYLFMSFHNSDRTHIYNAVVNTMKNGGFEMIEKGEDWNLIWTGYCQIEDIMSMNKYQKVNHFPNSVNLGRKDLLWKNVLRMRLKYPEYYNICPFSWILPEQQFEFENIKNLKFCCKKYFILKPTNSS